MGTCSARRTDGCADEEARLAWAWFEVGRGLEAFVLSRFPGQSAPCLQLLASSVLLPGGGEGDGCLLGRA